MHKYLIIENLISTVRCQELIDLSESLGYDVADIAYATGPKVNTQYRDNSRCLLRDEALRLELEALLMPTVQEHFHNYSLIKQGGEIDVKKFVKLSGNFRFYRYTPGQKFRKHRDSNNLEEGGVSLVTVLIYLNYTEFGGETKVYDPDKSDPVLVKPEQGKALIFEHDVAHSGEPVTEGIKYVLRTDFIYEHEKENNS